MTAHQNCWPLSISYGSTMLAVLVGLTTPATALSNSECSELLKRPGVYVSGSLLEPYRKALVESGRVVFEGGRVGRMTVMVGCNSGAFDNIAAQTTTRVPSPGEAKGTMALDQKGPVIAK